MISEFKESRWLLSIMTCSWLSPFCVFKQFSASYCIQEVLGRTNRLLSLVRHGPHWERRVQRFFYWRVSSSGKWRLVVRWVTTDAARLLPCHPLDCWICWTYFLDPEDGGDVFLRNFDFNSTDYRPHIPEDDTFRNHRCENLKSYTIFLSLPVYSLPR
jgi:hypothetical protein